MHLDVDEFILRLRADNLNVTGFYAVLISNQINSQTVCRMKTAVDFTSRLINGSLRYRASDKLQSVFSTPPPENSRKLDKNSDDCSKTWASRLKQLPCFLQLPPISLPARLDAVAIDYLREHSASSPKAIEDRSNILTNYLWSRPLMSEEKAISKSSKIHLSKDLCEDEGEDEGLTFALQNFTSQRESRISKDVDLKSWKSLKATNTVWPIGCVREHYLVEPSLHMTRLSEFLFEQQRNSQTSESVFPGIYHRRFMPSTKNQYNLVVCANTLLELPCASSRSRVISSLWEKTTDFLVLIEQGTKSGFQAILEARNFLLTNGGSDVHIFSPCPHVQICGKKDSICNIIVRYYNFGLTRFKNEPSNELISYLVISKGDWRRHQIPIIKPEPDQLPRIVTYKPSKSNQLIHDICLPSGDVERVLFPKKQTHAGLYYYMKQAHSGDIVPAEVMNANKPDHVIECMNEEDK
ncbi:Methyltransferase-like protein 17 isoform 4 [Schistosoma japonicum]|uniref:Methyltransferase-like protein 17 isoform 4 n=2 Tax=Schistosoma japonicum TaxID=6182 RepID=A0A4Z2D0P3_SCHJA|nr:Methyltransferase-like protein 17 isoform 4 [Schistosoma japonicum]